MRWLPLNVLLKLRFFWKAGFQCEQHDFKVVALIYPAALQQPITFSFLGIILSTGFMYTVLYVCFITKTLGRREIIIIIKKTYSAALNDTHHNARFTFLAWSSLIICAFIVTGCPDTNDSPSRYLTTAENFD